jgi:hypothetical protein
LTLSIFSSTGSFPIPINATGIELAACGEFLCPSEHCLVTRTSGARKGSNTGSNSARCHQRSYWHSSALRPRSLERKAKSDYDENQRVFNRPSAVADFDYWSRMSYWTLDEALALSFGKAPE